MALLGECGSAIWVLSDLRFPYQLHRLLEAVGERQGVTVLLPFLDISRHCPNLEDAK